MHGLVDKGVDEHLNAGVSQEGVDGIQLVGGAEGMPTHPVQNVAGVCIGHESNPRHRRAGRPSCPQADLELPENQPRAQGPAELACPSHLPIRSAGGHNVVPATDKKRVCQ